MSGARVGLLSVQRRNRALAFGASLANTPPSTERGRLPLLIPQLAGLRAVTIHVALSIITDRSPGRLAKAARTAAEARARMSSG